MTSWTSWWESLLGKKFMETSIFCESFLWFQDFGVRCIAEKLLKKNTGLLFAIVENPVESKVLHTCLTEVNFSKEVIIQLNSLPVTYLYDSIF